PERAPAELLEGPDDLVQILRIERRRQFRETHEIAEEDRQFPAFAPKRDARLDHSAALSFQDLAPSVVLTPHTAESAIAWPEACAT
ncbi:hypothetical protein, partial [Methylobacterium soli]|uniref:hypothetical protein n=1 Tax=Methylobacterium soli TaxID=553447 RepID=UPI001EE28AC5